MKAVDWGVDIHPARFPGAGDGRFAPTDSDDPVDMPAVRVAREHGYEPAPEAPLWTFLPAVWPEAARAWIPDDRVRHARVACIGEPERVVPWSTADYFEMEAEANWMLAECGLPARPPGRLWLLKPPPGQESLERFVGLLLASSKRAGLPVMATAQFVEHIRQDLSAWFDSGDPGTTGP